MSDVNAVPLVPSGTSFCASSFWDYDMRSLTSTPTLVQARAIAQREILFDKANHVEITAICNGVEMPIEVWIRESVPEINYNAFQTFDLEPNGVVMYDEHGFGVVKQVPKSWRLEDRLVGRENGHYIFEELPRSTGTYRISQLEKS